MDVMLVVGGLLVLAAFGVFGAVYFASCVARRRVHEPNELDDAIDFIYEPAHHVQLLRMLEQFDFECQRHRIQYWICGGTALGAARNGGFIPHDDDVDLAMPIADFNRMKDLHKKNQFMNGTRLKAQVDGSFFQIQQSNKQRNVFIDIFKVSRPKKHPDRIAFVGSARTVCPKQWWSHDEVFPLQKTAFHNLRLPVPKNNLPYIVRTFGEWDKQYKITHMHRNVFASICTWVGGRWSTPLTPSIQHAVALMTGRVKSSGYAPKAPSC